MPALHYFRLLLFFPLMLLLRLLSPIVKIRFGQLPSDHFGFSFSMPTVYWLEQQHSPPNERVFDIFVLKDRIVNRQAYTMWGRTYRISSWAKPLYEIAKSHRFFHTHLVPWREQQYADLQGLVAKNPRVLNFTSEESKRGEEELLRMGVPRGAQYVCLSARDASYNKSWTKLSDADSNSYRDTDINDYQKAADYLTTQGIYVIRMGAVVSKPLEYANDKIIDYATEHRSEFMDIYLCAHCLFYLGDSGGLVNVARVNKRPIVTTNWLPMGVASTANPNEIIIHKRLRSSQTGQLLSLDKQSKAPQNSFTLTEQYVEAGLEPIDNSPEEILQTTQEMLEKLRGSWKELDDTKALQQRYWNLFPPGTLLEPIRAQMGYAFLKSNL